jgi:hypothetical protein
MNVYKFLVIFSCLILQSISSAQFIGNEDAAFTPHRSGVCVHDELRIPLSPQEIGSLANFVQFARYTLDYLLRGQNFPGARLLRSYQMVKPILARLNDGRVFHPTPESNRKVYQHMSAISELNHEQFLHGSPDDYFRNLGCPYGSATFTTPYGNTAIITEEWLTLASILHNNNFEQSFDHSPSSPSGKGNWHHAFQTHNVIHLIPRAVHSNNHGALHPITSNSQINRQAFANERLRLNQAWALLAAIRSISSILKQYPQIDDDLSEYLEKCSSICSVPVFSSSAAGDIGNSRTLNNEYDDENDDDHNAAINCSEQLSGQNSSKALFGPRQALSNLPANQNWNGRGTF